MSWLFDVFPREVVSAVGWTLLHSLWQGGITAIFLYLALYMLRNKSANIKTIISVAALVIFAAAAFTTYRLISGSPFHINTYSEVYVKNNPVNTLMSVKIGEDVYKNFDTTISVFNADLKEFMNKNVDYIFTLWLLGLTFFVVRFMGGLLLMTRTRKCALRVEESKWNEYINRLCLKYNLKRRIEFGESRSLKVPVAMGFFKPIILFPFGVLSGLPQEQIEAIIAHEIAHIKRYDIFVNLFQSAAEIIFFFNPFVWWISGKIRLEREYCCDDMAISQCGDELIYAKALANLESMVESSLPLLAVPLFKNHNQLLRRINRMLQQDKNRNNIKEKFYVSVIFVGLLISITIFKNANAQLAPPEKPAELLVPKAPAALNGGIEFTKWNIDSTKVKKETSEFTFYEKVNGEKKEYRGKLKYGELTSLYIDGEKISLKDFGKYKALVDKRILTGETEIVIRENEMKKSAAELKQEKNDWSGDDETLIAFIKDVKQVLVETGIKNLKDNYSLVLDAKKLMINYKKMPDELRDKVKKLYMKHYKEDIGDQILLRNAHI